MLFFTWLVSSLFLLRRLTGREDFLLLQISLIQTLGFLVHVHKIMFHGLHPSSCSTARWLRETSNGTEPSRNSSGLSSDYLFGPLFMLLRSEQSETATVACITEITTSKE